MRLSRKTIASHWKESETFPTSVLAKTKLHVIEKILRQLPIVSQPKFNCIWSILFQDVSKLLYRRNSIASTPKIFETFPNFVLAKTHLHLLQKYLRQFQNVLQPKISCIWSKFSQDMSKMIRSPNSNASYRKCSTTFLNCVLAQIHLHPLQKHPRQIQNVLQPKLGCIWLKLFRDLSKLCLSWISIASYRKNPKQFAIVSEPNFSCILSNLLSHSLKLRLSQNSIAINSI